MPGAVVPDLSLARKVLRIEAEVYPRPWSTSLFMSELGRYPLLNAAEEVELAKRIEAGLFAEETLNADVKLDPKLRDITGLLGDTPDAALQAAGTDCDRRRRSAGVDRGADYYIDLPAHAWYKESARASTPPSQVPMG